MGSKMAVFIDKIAWILVLMLCLENLLDAFESLGSTPPPMGIKMAVFINKIA